MRPVRRAGWVGAASGAPAAESYVDWVYMRRRGAQAFLFHSLSHACCPRKAANHLVVAANGRRAQSAAGTRTASYKAEKR